MASIHSKAYKACINCRICNKLVGMKKSLLHILFVMVTLLVVSGCSSKVPELGINGGQFSPCPETNNCVSSQALDSQHAIAPIKAHGGIDKVMVDLSNAIESMFGSKVVEINGPYLRAEYTSRIFRFVDDLECYYDVEEGLVQVRSSSRVGYADFNANRQRVEDLRIIFEKTQ